MSGFQSTGASRLRGWKNRLAPVLVWCAAVAALFVLSREKFSYVDGIGLAESFAVNVAPTENGKLDSMVVDLFDLVEVGQTIAVMDDTLLQAEFMIADAELGRLRSEVDAERRRMEVELAQRESDTIDELRRYQMNEEDARLQLLDMTVQEEANTIRLERLKIEMDRNRRLVEQQLGDEARYDETRLEYEELKRELEQNRASIAAARTQLAQATKRREERELRVESQLDDNYLEPIRLAINVQEANLHQIRELRAQCVLRAPISGQVTQVFHRGGEIVLAGDPILMITDSSTQRVVAYLREDTVGHVTENAEVILRSERRPDAVTRARVARTGVGIQELPVSAWATPFLPERGFPVLIHELAENVLVPGERVTVRIQGND